MNKDDKVECEYEMIRDDESRGERIYCGCNGLNEVNIKGKGWEYCPYCGKPIKIKGDK